MGDIFDNMSTFISRLPADTQVHVFLHDQIKAGDTSARELVNQRATMLTEQDRQQASAFMDIGYYKGLDGDQRFAAWLLAVELGRMQHLEALNSRFQLYSPTQALFNAFPKLLAQTRNHELVAYQAGKPIRHDGVIHWDGAFVRVDPHLSPSLVASLLASFPRAPLYVRLDPDFVSRQRPKEYLTEEVLVPADPHWWKTLGIHRGEEKGSHYEIQEANDAKGDLPSFMEYRVRGVRTLEVHAQRTKENYLSMMVEELVDLREAYGYLLGRCIHWDTDALKGTSPDVASVKHLDLAMNVYAGVAAEHRLKESLSDGRVSDATFRTHLLRIEEIPVQALLSIAALFFVSSLLLNDWFKDQFRLPR